MLTDRWTNRHHQYTVTYAICPKILTNSLSAHTKGHLVRTMTYLSPLGPFVQVPVPSLDAPITAGDHWNRKYNVRVYKDILSDPNEVIFFTIINIFVLRQLTWTSIVFLWCRHFEDKQISVSLIFLRSLIFGRIVFAGL